MSNPASILPTGWKLLSVKDAFAIRNNLRKPISQEEREKIQGEYPYYGPTKAQGYISSYEQDGKFALIGEDGDHFLKYQNISMTQLISGKCTVNNHAHVVQGTEICTAEWFYYFFMHKELTSFLTRQGAGRFKLNKAALEKIPVLVPPVAEQTKIAQILSTWDKAIATTEHLIANSQQQKQALMQQLLTGQKRLQGFSQKWSEASVASCVLGSSLRNSNTRLGVEDVMSVNKTEGMIPMREQTIGKSIDRYKIVRPGWFAYNPMRINVGSICRWAKENDCLVSPDYVVFECNEDVLLGSYFDHFRQSEPWASYMDNAGNGSVRVRIYLNDLSQLEIPLPSLAEQQKIAQVLSTADAEITNLQAQLAKLKLEKKALMQQLLTGQRRVKPDADAAA